MSTKQQLSDELMDAISGGKLTIDGVGVKIDSISTSKITFSGEDGSSHFVEWDKNVQGLLENVPGLSDKVSRFLKGASRDRKEEYEVLDVLREALDGYVQF